MVSSRSSQLTLTMHPSKSFTVRVPGAAASLALLLLVSVFLLHALPLPSADWSNWRGPNGLGVSAEKTLPLHWSKTQNIAWSATLPGKGASSPIVVGDRVYITTQ